MTTTNRGKIVLRNGNFPGYVVIENAGMGRVGGHKVTMNFLEANRRHFDRSLEGGRLPVLTIKTARVTKFMAYCEANGIDVEVGA
jgi:hypothetical protein